jgi:hypothetical protein
MPGVGDELVSEPHAAHGHAMGLVAVDAIKECPCLIDGCMCSIEATTFGG